MPTLFVYLFAMLAVIMAWFILFKRPIYEAIGVSFIVLLTMSGTWGQLGSFFDKAISTSLIYSMTAFVAMSIVIYCFYNDKEIADTIRKANQEAA